MCVGVSASTHLQGVCSCVCACECEYFYAQLLHALAGCPSVGAGVFVYVSVDVGVHVYVHMSVSVGVHMYVQMSVSTSTHSFCTRSQARMGTA